MKSHIKTADKKRLSKTVDKLTGENQRYILGVLEALAFAQAEQDGAGPGQEDAPPGGIRPEPWLLIQDSGANGP